MLPPHRPEIVAGPGAEAGVEAVVLEDVADVLDAVGGAPVPQLAGEVLLVLAGDDVHIVVADLALTAAAIMEEGREGGLFPACGAAVEFLPDPVRPGQRHRVADFDHPEGVIARQVVKARLIREKSGEGLAEILLIVGIMGLIDGVQEDFDRILLKERDVVVAFCGRPLLFGVDKEGPVPFRDVHPQPAVFHRTGHVGEIAVNRFPIHLVIPAEDDGDQLFRLVLAHPAHHKSVAEAGRHLAPPAGQRAVYLHRPLEERPALEMVGGVFDGAVGKAGREMGVVQNPDLHPPLPGLVHHDIDVLPPLRPDIVGVGPGFQADRLDAAAVDLLHILPQGRFIGPVLPEKGQDVVAILMLQ